jgi:hypothetical protein
MYLPLSLISNQVKYFGPSMQFYFYPITIYWNILCLDQGILFLSACASSDF